MKSELNAVISHLKKFAEKQNWEMESFRAEISSWGESATLNCTMYSKEKTENGHSVIAISASMDADNYNLRVLELKFKAEYAERIHELGRNLIVS